jgi:SAM-dependent methyltransferase
MSDFDFAARHYNRMTGYPQRIDRLADLIAPWIKKWNAQSALDAGCGGGALLFALHRLGIDRDRLAGLDLSEAMLNLTVDNAREQGIELELAQVSFAQAGESFPKRFDTVFATGNALYSPDSDEAMQEALKGLHGALAPGGHLLIQSLNTVPFLAGQKRVISHRHVAGVHYLRSAVPVGDRLMFQLTVIDPEQPPTVEARVWEIWDASRMTACLQNSGFDEIELYGGLDGSPFDPDQSTDLVIAAQRPA